MHAISFAVFVNACLISSTLAAQTEDAFTLAIQSFKQRQFAEAIMLFETELKTNPENFAAIYNLGVAYYRSAKYSEAHDKFTSLINQKSYQPLAQYNLGLTAYQLGNIEEAKAWFLQLSQLDSADVNLQQVAAEQYRLIDEEQQSLIIVQPKTTEKSQLSTSLMLNAGYDDNVLDLTDFAAPQTVSDQFFDVYVLAKWRFSENSHEGFALAANYFDKNYLAVDAYDFSIATALLDYQMKYEQWQFRYRLAQSDSSLGQLQYQQMTRLDMRATHSRTTTQKLVLRYRYDDIATPDLLYEPYAGQRQRVNTEIEIRKMLHKLRFGLEFEFNDRADRTTTNNHFISYSATRSKLYTAWYYQLATDLRLRLNLDYRQSEYNDVNTAVGVTRQENKLDSGLRVDWTLDKNWFLNLNYQHVVNRSNLAEYEYSRNLTSIGLSAYF